MESETQSKIILDFMKSLAPQLTVYSLENGASVAEAASLILESSMRLSVLYTQINETLTAAAQNPLEADQPETSETAAPVRQTKAGVPGKKPDVPDLPGQKERGRPSPLSPEWEPPDPYR